MSLVACPKCKGGCDLCGRTGEVQMAVANVYVREEARATMRVDRAGPFPDELPTRPDILRKADRRQRVVRFIGLILIGTVLGILVGIVVAVFLR